MLLAFLQLSFELQRYTGCFQDGASVVYSAELQQAVVNFVPIYNPSCMFGNTVQLQLYFDSAVVQTHVYSGYQHGITRYIVMRNVVFESDLGDPVTPEFAILNISTLSHYAVLNVESIGMQQSAMDRCFEQGGEVFEFDDSDLRFALQVTNACRNEVSSIKSAYIALGTTITAFDVDFSVSNSNGCQVLQVGSATMLKCFATGNFTRNMQTAFVSSSVEFTLEVESNDHTIAHTFYRVQVGALPNIFADYHLLYIYESAIFVDVYYYPYYLAYLLQIIEQYKTNKAIYRISLKNKHLKEYHTMQYITIQFIPEQHYFVFACTDQVCKDSLASLVKEELTGVEGAFDIAFYHDSEFVQIVSKTLKVSHSCNKRIIGYLKNAKNLTLYMYKDLKHQCNIDLDSTFYAEFYIFTNGKRESLDAAFWPQRNNSIDVSKISRENISKMIGSSNFAIRITQNGYVDVMVVDTIARSSYSVLSWIVCSFGTAIFIVAAVTSVMHIIMFMKVLKRAQKRCK